MASPRSLDTMKTSRSPSSDHIGAQSTGPTGFGTARRPATSERSAIQRRAPSGPDRSRVSNATRVPSGDRRGANTDVGSRPRTLVAPSTSTSARSNPTSRCARTAVPATIAVTRQPMIVATEKRMMRPLIFDSNFADGSNRRGSTLSHGRRPCATGMRRSVL